MKQPKQLFVSYSRRNKADVDELIRRLPNLGYQGWVDSALRGGQTWWDEILRQIKECDAFVAVISRDSLNSAACQRELGWAWALGKPILPLAVERLLQALPRELSLLQMVDYSEPGQDAAYALAGALAALPKAPALPEVLPDPPAAPLSYLTDLADQVARPASLSHEQQRQIATQLQSAVRSADPEERQGALLILERFSSSNELYADVEASLRQLRTKGESETPTAPPPQQPQQPQPQPSQQPQPQPPGPQAPPWQGQSWPMRPPDNYLIWCILTTVLCCFPVGIFAIIQSNNVSGLWAQGRYAEAQQAANRAKNLAIWTAIAGVSFWLVAILIEAINHGSSTSGY